MLNVLIYHQNHKKIPEVEALLVNNNVRFKSSNDADIVGSWLENRHFDAFFIEAGIEFGRQQKLVDRLWRKNSEAHLLVFELDKHLNQEHFAVRLFGAEIAKGPEALRIIDDSIQRMKSQKTVASKDFHILVVEDLDSPREIICSFVEALGYPAVKGVRSVDEALVELKQARDWWSCILTDIKMPRVSGIELIKYVRSHAELDHLPIIVLTAWGTPDTLIESLEAGATSFLVKPPRKVDLKRELDRARRISIFNSNPRMIFPEESETLKQLLEEKGLGL